MYGAKQVKVRFLVAYQGHEKGGTGEYREGIAKTLVSLKVAELANDKLDSPKDDKPKRASGKPSRSKAAPKGKRKPPGRPNNDADRSVDGTPGT